MCNINLRHKLNPSVRPRLLPLWLVPAVSFMTHVSVSLGSTQQDSPSNPNDILTNIGRNFHKMLGHRNSVEKVLSWSEAMYSGIGLQQLRLAQYLRKSTTVYVLRFATHLANLLLSSASLGQCPIIRDFPGTVCNISNQLAGSCDQSSGPLYLRLCLCHASRSG